MNEEETSVKRLLLLIRHAKSSWSDPGLTDIERPLNKRGKRDAPFMGEKLAERKILPDLFLSSPAKRAKKTAQKVAEAIGFSKEQIVIDRDIYHADDEELLEIIGRTEGEVKKLFVVGHNYTLTDLACQLTDTHIENVPTSGMVGIAFDCNWEEIGPGAGELLFFDYPKKYQPLD